MNFYGQELNFYRANLHTHSTNSDGKFTPDELIAKYAAQGYEVLAFTDHRTANAVSKLNGRGMTLLSGIELHPLGPRGIPWHLLALGVPEDFPDCGPDETGQEVIDRVNAAGGICYVAHPYWCTFCADEVMSLRDFAGIEVYNTSTRYIGKDYNMQLWDEMLDRGGRACNAIAVDDIHRECDFLGGWTMIGTRERTPEAIVAALRDGNYYASQGPQFTRLSYENGIFKAEFSPCRQAIVMTNGSAGNGLVDGEYTGISFDASQLKPGSYLRCQIQDANGKFAWSNPITV